MRTSQRKSMSFVDDAILSSIFALVGVCATIVPVAASNISCTSANKLALRAYCSEAYRNSALLANGHTSYKEVANLAAASAMAEYPNVCPDRSAWKARITAMLDQYGDEALPDFCNENPEPVRSR